MESSKLQNLILDVLSPLANNPVQILQANTPKKYQQLLPLVLSMMKTFRIDVNHITLDMLQKIESAPSAFWQDLEVLIMGVIQGDTEAYEKAKHLLGGVMNGKH